MFICWVLLPSIASASNNFFTKISINYLQPKNNSVYKDNIAAYKNNSSFTHSFMFEGGMGYQVNEKVGIGFTLQYGKSKLNAGSLGNDAYPITTVDSNGFPIRIDCTPFSISKLKVKTTAILANVNYNIGKIYNFSPYLFVGVGMAKHKYGNSDSIVNCLEEGSSTYRPVDYKIIGRVQKNFAWSIGIGGQLPVNEQASVDIALRYYDYGRINAENKKYMNDILLNNVGSARVKIKGAMFVVGLVIKF